jgi:Helix-turn-helix domain
MTSRLPNPRLAKIHRNYTVDEAARVFSSHRNTVRSWIKQGLPTIDDKRPRLIRGADLVTFLRARRKRNKRPCGPGEIYCVRCRVPRAPWGNTADYEVLTATLGNLIAICSACEALMYRRVNLVRLDEIRGKVEVTLPQALPRLSESVDPSVNSDLE